MTKEQIYVHIKSEQEAKEAKEIFSNYKQYYFSEMHLYFKKFPYLIFINNWWDIVTLVDDSRTEITLPELEQLLKAEKENLQVGNCSEIPNSSKPDHYAKQGIDTFARMEANCTKEECLAFVKGNIDKYNWRDKGQDVADFEKIIAFANWGIKLKKK